MRKSSLSSKLNLVFYFCFISLRLYCQPDITWQRCYGGSSIDRFYDALITQDNGILVSIDNFSTDGDLEGLYPQAGWVIKFDSAFELEWQQYYGTEECQIIIKKIIQLQNGNYVIGGTNTGYDLCTNAIGGDGDFAIIITNPDGEVLTYKTFGSPGSDGFVDLIQTKDYGFLVTAESLSEGGDIPFHYYGAMGSTDVVIFKLDSLANLQWLRNLGGSDYDVIMGNSVEPKQGMYIVNVASLSNDHDLSGSGIIGGKRWIIVLDSLGNVINENFISTNDVPNGDGSTFMLNEKVAVVGGGEFASDLFPIPEGHANPEGYIGFFDTASLSFNIFFQWGGTGMDYLVKYCQDEYGNFYFLGYSRSTDLDLPGNYNLGEAFDYWILSTDSNFQKRWSRNFGGADDCGDLNCSSFQGDIVYKDNMIYVFVKNVVPDALPDFDIQCGFSDPDGGSNTDAWLVAFDLNTLIPESTEPERAVNIYPNPTSGIINISFNELPRESLSIVLFDITGREVYTKSSYALDPFQVDVSILATGIYTVKIFNAFGIFAQRTIIIQ